MVQVLQRGRLNQVAVHNDDDDDNNNNNNVFIFRGLHIK